MIKIPGINAEADLSKVFKRLAEAGKEVVHFCWPGANDAAEIEKARAAKPTVQYGRPGETLCQHFRQWVGCPDCHPKK